MPLQQHPFVFFVPFVAIHSNDLNSYRTLTAIGGESLAVDGVPQPIEGLFFELAHPFSTDPQFVAYLLIGRGF